MRDGKKMEQGKQRGKGRGERKTDRKVGRTEERENDCKKCKNERKKYRIKTIGQIQWKK